MARPAYDLDLHKDNIIRWILQDGLLQSEVCERLQEEHGLKISRGTLGRRLTRWKVSVQPKVQDSPGLRERIGQLWAIHTKDKTTVIVLESEGYHLTLSGLVRLRKKMGLFKTEPSLRQHRERGALMEKQDTTNSDRAGMDEEEY